jgi:hypothetical protein
MAAAAAGIYKCCGNEMAETNENNSAPLDSNNSSV